MSAALRIEPAKLAYAEDGTPYSASYDDIYHASEGGLAQAQHVFIAGNRLQTRWRERPNFTILETGFGLGLSFLATWQAWRNDPQRCQRLHFISTELHPFRGEDLAHLHAQWPELATLAAQLQAVWPPLTPGFHHLLLDQGRVALTLLFGDANDTLKHLVGKADAIYLDGFAPQKNPQLWSPDLLAQLTQHAAPGATLASWCVAGHVRTALAAQGWQVEKQSGFAHKRHMLTATWPGQMADAPYPEDAIVIGAGIAGCSTAEALARRGFQVTLLEREAEPALAGSANPRGLLHPMLAKDDNLAARLSRAAYLYGLRLLHGFGPDAFPWQDCGILQIAEDEADAAMQRACCAGFPADYVSWLNQTAASACAGLPVSAGGWWFPQGAWISPRDLCRTLLQAAGERLQVRYQCEVASLRRVDERWHALDAAGNTLAHARHVVLANAHAANRLLPELALTLRPIRGQLTYLPDQALAGLKTTLCGVGYVIRSGTEQAVLGASFIEDDEDEALRSSEHADNLRKLALMLPQFEQPQPPEALPGRVGMRAASRDRMPLVGSLPDSLLKEQHTLANLPRQPGLHAMLGFGARGMSWAPLSAELLAAQINGECLPLESPIVRSLDPARFHLKQTRRDANA